MATIEQVNANLIKRGFKSVIAQTAEQATALALEIIGDGSVGFGGSVTLQRLNLYDSLVSRGNEVYWHWKNGAEDKRKSLCADWYACSANAVTEDGVIIETDGSGNRIACLSFGPENALLIIGKNKIVKDCAEGVARIKSGECAGLNAKRLGISTPCAADGKCRDCSSPHRMCSVTAFFERPSKGLNSVCVILVNEELGY